MGVQAHGGVRMRGDLHPLDSVLWFQRIEIIASGELGLENSLRHACHMLQLTPTPFRHVVRRAMDEDSFEALLEEGHLDAAARHLVAQPTALTVDRRPDARMVTAAISCVILKRVIKGTGETEAEAILDAWTSCLLALRVEYGADLVRLCKPDNGETLSTNLN